MAHNSLIRVAGPSGWNLNTVVQPSEFAALDAAQFKAINGDDGGTWAPTTPLVIGGAGMQLLALQLNGSSYVTYLTPHAVTRIVPCTIASCTFLANGQGFDPASNTLTATSPTTLTPSPMGINGYPYPSAFTFTTAYSADSTHAYCISVPLNDEIVDGATLLSATLTFATTTHSSLPASFPAMQFYRADVSQNPAVLTIVAEVSDAPASLAVYSAKQRSVSFNFPAGYVADKSKYFYFALVLDEHGSNAIAGNQFLVVSLSMTVADARPG